jgi:hypothetical protein
VEISTWRACVSRSAASARRDERGAGHQLALIAAMRLIFASLAFATTAIATSPAFAQTYEERHPRVGLELGAGLQAGNLFCQSENNNDCNGVDAAGGLDLQAGWFTSPRIGLVLDLWTMAHTENNFTIAQYINTVGVKIRLAPILYVQGGIGAAHASLSYGNLIASRSDDAFAIMGAVGLVLLRGHRFDLSVELRAGNGFYGDKNHDGQADTVARNTGIGAQLTFFDF